MENRFDEFCLALAEHTSRREALRRAGVLLAGAVAASFGVNRAAPAAASCSRFCRRYPRGQERRHCLFICAQCGRRPRRDVCVGGRGEANCCDPGLHCCSDDAGGVVCVDTRTSQLDCGRCNHPCQPNEECINSRCEPVCQEGTTACLDGAGGTVCCEPHQTCCPNPSGAPIGVTCRDLLSDEYACGSCDRCCLATGDADQCVNGSCACRDGAELCDYDPKIFDRNPPTAHCRSVQHCCSTTFWTGPQMCCDFGCVPLWYNSRARTVCCTSKVLEGRATLAYSCPDNAPVCCHREGDLAPWCCQPGFDCNDRKDFRCIPGQVGS